MKLYVTAELVALALATAAPSLPGCTGDSSPKHANVKPDDMPQGETWSGVYFHPTFGFLHLVEQGTNVVGKWRRANQSHWGELSGTKTGNVLHFTWREHQLGMVGPSATTSGRGYFVYKMDSENLGELDGQYGMSNDEVGNAWRCRKQQRMLPDLKSISGDTGDTAPPAAGKWE